MTFAVEGQEVVCAVSFSSVPSASRISLLENCATMPRFSGSEGSVEAISQPFGLALLISVIWLIIDLEFR